MEDHLIEELEARLVIHRQILAEALTLICYSHPHGQAIQRSMMVRGRLTQIDAQARAKAAPSSCPPSLRATLQAQSEEARELLAHFEVAMRDIQATPRDDDVVP